MLKKLLVLGLLVIGVPVFAGQYEDALRTGQPVCLYLHTKTCKYCKQFNPVFEKMFNNYKKTYRFVSIDADSPYGMLLMQDLRAGYVPFVALADARRQYFLPIAPSCAIEAACMTKEMNSFIKK